MASNSTGTRRENLDTFDKLPASARAALANAQFNWAPTNIFRAWNRGANGFKTGAQIAKLVSGWDADTHARDVKRGKVGVAP